MVSNTKNIPKLRFKGFSGEWQLTTLDDLCDEFKSGKSITSKDIDEKGEYPVYGGNGLRGYTNHYTHDDDIVLIGRQGALCGNLNLVKGKAFISEHAVVIKENNISNLSWLFYRLDYLNLNNYSESSAQPGLSVNKIKKIKVLSPTKQEQQKIADFLSTVDKKIQQLKQKQQLLQQYKKGMMQKLFSQQIRFKDENGLDYPEWDERELGDILYYEQPTKYIVNNTDYDDSYDIPVLTAGKSFILGYTSEKEGIFNSNLPVIIFDDFTTDNKYVNFPFKVKSSAMKILYNDKFHSNIKFIYESINMINFSKGDEHKRYWISEYQYISIGFPSLPEQQKIADFLSSIDKKIDAVNEQISQMAQFKQGLLQQLFV